ncbi:hypothetical protein AGLY_000066 [Aphis glycines]|uniref:Uncharacterized protein n=1 Tax=Aphis glycines TaxID=307491 RepID=A0A6G0U5X7_APHGL|nr:hypothetical protein AGLY_000066 [Aphis glycines]
MQFTCLLPPWIINSIGAPIVNIVVYTDSKSPPKLQFRYSNISNVDELIGCELANDLIFSKAMHLNTIIYLSTKYFPKSDSLIHDHHDWKVVILPTELPIDHTKPTIFCISATCNKSSMSLRLVTFIAGILNFLLRKHAIARPKYIRRSLKFKPLLIYKHYSLLANDAKTSAAS